MSILLIEVTMKKFRFLLGGLLILLTFSVSAQQHEKEGYDFKIPLMSEKMQAQVGENFHLVSFGILGIKSEMQRKMLVKTFSANPDFKNVRIDKSDVFYAFMDKKLDAKTVREILLAQGVDYKFDQYKFKGCYRNEVLKQNHKK